MAPIRFPAGLYGDADWAFQDLPEALPKQILLDARTRVLQELYCSYFNAVEVYELSSHTERWIESTSPQAFAQAAGKIYVTLDYFAACLPPRRMKRLGASKEAVFSEYLGRRSLENLQANSASLLSALAISNLIPDQWFPEKKLEKLIEREIQRAGFYSNVDIDLDLGLPPGGLDWLSRATLETVTRVREKLAAGQPWPVRMVRGPGRLDGNRQVIVYACHEQRAGRLCLEILEPDGTSDGHALQIEKRRERLEVTEILEAGRRQPVLGLLYETYDPAPVPQECIPWWLRWKAVRRAWLGLLTCKSCVRLRASAS